ncbi:MAG TPA: hypothetical protein VF041_22330 [Gemmatimonadaceae bacterium]
MAAVLAVPALLLAQGAPASTDVTPRPRDPLSSYHCLDTLSASAMRRVVVYLEAEVPDTSARTLLPQADLIAQSVAQQLRALLGAAPDSLPSGEPALTWRTLERDYTGGLTAIVRRHGPLVWRGGAPGTDSAAGPLLVRAARAAYPDGMGVIWPDGLAADSAIVRLRVRFPSVDREGRVTTPPVRVGFPVFSILEPWEEPVRAARKKNLDYPTRSEREGAEGTVILQYLVDTTGRADLGTVRERWISDEPRPTGRLARYYEEFVESARRSLVDARFHPARIGGCPVPQLVQQPFVFKQRGG